MNTHHHPAVVRTASLRWFALLSLLLGAILNPLHAQVPQLLHYQGRAIVSNTNFEGAGLFKFALVNGAGNLTYWSNDGSSTTGNQPGAGVSLPVTKGLYALLLGDTTLSNMTAIPASVFNNSDVRLRVWFNDGAHGYQQVAPDQRIAAVGYAMSAASVSDGAITAGKLAPNAVAAASVQDGSLTAAKVAASQVVKSLNNLKDSVTLTAGANVTITPSGNNLEIAALGGGTGWGLAGNAGTLAGANFIGTTDLVPFEVRANNYTVMRYSYANDLSSPNIVGGLYENVINPGYQGSVIAGGGGIGNPNQISANASAIGGGSGNVIQGGENVIAGGLNNFINGTNIFIGGGWSNRAVGNSSVIGGGDFNTNSGRYATVAGGWSNTSGNFGATVAGGSHNTSSGSSATVGGGSYNISSYSAATIGGGSRNLSSGFAATIAGGHYNTNSGDWATVGGGLENISSDFYATVGGGFGNTSSSIAATVGGGENNTSSGSGATVGGGSGNISSNSWATVPGGRSNTAGGQHSFAAGRRAKAMHNGSFVWGDSTDANVSSTGNNQFVVRASGGTYFSSTNGAQVMTLSGSREGNFSGQLVYIENTNSTGNTGPALRLFSTGDNVDGVLNVGTSGTGKIMAFGGAGGEVANVSSNGTFNALAFNPTSDRNAKENFAPVNVLSVLDRVAALPITRWNFKREQGTEHIGPMAQDFQAAFGVGTDEKHIATVDADGVALAAIQGLNQKFQEELQRRDTENAALKKSVAELTERVGKLSEKLESGAR